MNCFHRDVRRYDLIIHRLESVEMTGTNDSDLHGTTVYRAKRISSWFGDFVKVEMSSATKEPNDFSFLQTFPIL